MPLRRPDDPAGASRRGRLAVDRRPQLGRRRDRPRQRPRRGGAAPARPARRGRRATRARVTRVAVGDRGSTSRTPPTGRVADRERARRAPGPRDPRLERAGPAGARRRRRAARRRRRRATRRSSCSSTTSMTDERRRRRRRRRRAPRRPVLPAAAAGQAAPACSAPTPSRRLGAMWLEVLSGEDAGRVVEIAEAARSSLGRVQGADLVIRDRPRLAPPRVADAARTTAIAAARPRLRERDARRRRRGWRTPCSRDGQRGARSATSRSPCSRRSPR